MALTRGVPPRPHVFAAQADVQPFAALLDAGMAPVPASGADSAAAAAQPNQRNPAADTGSGTQNGAGAAASAGSPSSGAASSQSAAPDNCAPAQSGAKADATQGTAAETSDGKPASNGNDSAAPTPGAADSAHQAAKNGAPITNKPAIETLLPQPSADGKPNAPSGGRANNVAMPSANNSASTDATDAEKGAPYNAAPAPVAAAIADANGSASADGATPGATRPSGDGKDDQKDHESGSADAAAAGQTQLPSPAPVQPLAAAVVVNATPDSAPPAAAKPGLAISDGGKGRAKVTLTPSATEQTAPTQGDTTDATAGAVDSGNANAAPGPSTSDDSTGDAPATTAQQINDQPPVPATTSATPVGQFDFASLVGMERFGLHGEATGSVNGASAGAAPNAATNAAMAPNFGILVPNASATNTDAPAAAALEPAVPLAGLAVAIAARAQAGSSQFDIRLDPPELGRIDVRLDVDSSGQVRTHVTVDRADTLQLLQSQEPQLERALEQAGLKTADNGLQFTLRDQSFAGQNGSTGGQHYADQPAARLVIPESDAAPIDTAQIYARLRLGNGLDISV